LTTSDLVTALAPVVDVLDSLGVAYFVGGSVASSAHGVPRASIDVDEVADLEWFRAGGEVSERQWSDVVGVLRMGAKIDRDYLVHWATALGLGDLMARALGDSEPDKT
jgi:hypothetical protein